MDGESEMGNNIRLGKKNVSDPQRWREGKLKAELPNWEKSEKGLDGNEGKKSG